jgi:hypothetical protein
MYRTWTDDDLINAIKESKTISDVVRKVGLKSNFSGNHQSIRMRIKELDLDISHFSECIHKKLNTSKKIPLSKILIKDSAYKNSTGLKRRLINEGIISEKCSECDITHWNGEKLSLHLDHINGINNDNRIENLRLLCPNCHSLTPTYCRGQRVKK